jgi:hypothetical protein
VDRWTWNRGTTDDPFSELSCWLSLYHGKPAAYLGPSESAEIESAILACMVETCFSRTSLRLKDLLQCGQGKGESVRSGP